jgi:hypothetical protein
MAIGAVVLLVSLFVDWYRPGGDAWAVFEWVDLLLAGIAVAALASLVARSRRLTDALPLLALVALAVVAVQLVDLPPAARGADRESGAWLALGASALMGLGAALGLAGISITVDVRGRERRRTAAIDARQGAADEPPTVPVAPVPADADRTQTLDPIDLRRSPEP